MAMIDIEYRHAAEPAPSDRLRRGSVEEMREYLTDLVCEMQMADISARYIDTEAEGPNTVRINGRDVHEILDGLEIRMTDSGEPCDLDRPSLVSFGRPVTDWDRETVEDIPDLLMKNAVAKVFADISENRIL